MPTHDFLLIKMLLNNSIEATIENQTQISDLNDSITESIDDIKEQLQDLEEEINDRLTFLEHRVIDFFDAYEDSILQKSAFTAEELEELPFP